MRVGGALVVAEGAERLDQVAPRLGVRLAGDGGGDRVARRVGLDRAERQRRLAAHDPAARRCASTWPSASIAVGLPALPSARAARDAIDGPLGARRAAPSTARPASSRRASSGCRCPDRRSPATACRASGTTKVSAAADTVSVTSCAAPSTTKRTGSGRWNSGVSPATVCVCATVSLRQLLRRRPTRSRSSARDGPP